MFSVFRTTTILWRQAMASHPTTQSRAPTPTLCKTRSMHLLSQILTNLVRGSGRRRQLSFYCSEFCICQEMSRVCFISSVLFIFINIYKKNKKKIFWILIPLLSNVMSIIIVITIITICWALLDFWIYTSVICFPCDLYGLSSRACHILVVQSATKNSLGSNNYNQIVRGEYVTLH